MEFDVHVSKKSSPSSSKSTIENIGDHIVQLDYIQIMLGYIIFEDYLTGCYSFHLRTSCLN